MPIDPITLPGPFVPAPLAGVLVLFMAMLAAALAMIAGGDDGER